MDYVMDYFGKVCDISNEKASHFLGYQNQKIF